MSWIAVGVSGDDLDRRAVASPQLFIILPLSLDFEQDGSRKNGQ